MLCVSLALLAEVVPEVVIFVELEAHEELRVVILPFPFSHGLRQQPLLSRCPPPGPWPVSSPKDTRVGVSTARREVPFWGRQGVPQSAGLDGPSADWFAPATRTASTSAWRAQRIAPYLGHRRPRGGRLGKRPHQDDPAPAAASSQLRPHASGPDLPTRVDAGVMGSGMGLTRAESRVAQWLAAGKPVRDIAITSGRAESWILTYLNRVHRKLGYRGGQTWHAWCRRRPSAPFSRGRRKAPGPPASTGPRTPFRGIDGPLPQRAGIFLPPL